MLWHKPWLSMIDSKHGFSNSTLLMLWNKPWCSMSGSNLMIDWFLDMHWFVVLDSLLVKVFLKRDLLRID